MKTIILSTLLVFQFISQAQAITFEVVGKNGQMLFTEQRTAELPSNVGKVSVEVFNRNHLPYKGDVSGFSEIFDMGQHVELVSDHEAKAHGWCFSIDGVVPETMADETPVVNQDSIIQWYSGHALYKDGQWLKQCVKN